MIATIPYRLLSPRGGTALVLLGLGLGLAGCAGSVGDLGDNLTMAFADPARYDYYDCKQLQDERKGINGHIADLQRLMAKADTGVAGPVVAELAYRNDYIALRGQSKFLEEAWRRNKCVEVPDATPASAAGTPPPSAKGAKGKGKGGMPAAPRSGSAVY